MLDVKDIYWLAGLYEGEGSFGLNNGRRAWRACPTVQLAMTDKDVVDKVAVLLNNNLLGPYNNGVGGKDYYRVQLMGSKAIGFMMTILALMGERRQQKIKETIQYWKQTGCRGSNQYGKK